MVFQNFDMIGGDTSWGVFDGSGKAYGFTPPPGSAHIEKLFSDYLVNKNLQVTPFGFDNNTDYVGLLSLGIPVGGLHTGADDFYHSAGDDINNIGWEFLVTNSKAAAHVLATYALDLQGIPKRAERVRIPPKSLRTMMAKQPQTPRNSCGDHAHHTEL